MTESTLPISLEEGGRPYFASQEVFDSQFSTGFVNGGGNIQYRLELGQDIYPRGGFLFLKVVSQHAQAAVMVEASVLNGIQFSDPSAETSTVLLTDSQQHTIRVNFGAIALHGSRIARVPFHIESGIMDGRYLISVVEENGTASWMETAPVFLKVESDLSLLGEQWLATDQMAQAGPTQPAVLLNANVAAYQPLPSATATPLTAAPATPTPAASGPTPDLAPTAVPTVAPTPTGRVDVIQAVNFTWEQLLTAYYGTCRNVYEQRIEGKLAMNWEAFRAAVIYYNPDLANTNCMFDPFREYWLPTAAAADVVR